MYDPIMPFAPVLIFITGLASCQGALMKTASAAVSSLLHNHNGVDVKTLVASLAEVAKGLQAEDKKAWEVAQDSKSGCKRTANALKLSLDKAERAMNRARGDYQEADAQNKALQANKAELQDQVASTNAELNSLQSRLKKMRVDKGLLKLTAVKSLRQVDSVIAKASAEERSLSHNEPTTMQKKMSNLAELSRGLLSLLQTDDEVRDERPVAMNNRDKQAPSLILKADRLAVLRASDSTQRGFDEEEKKVLDLIEVQRSKLKDLEDDLQELQPAISNKLKQTMEINRTLAAAARSMQRDRDLQDIEKDRCAMVAGGLDGQKQKRRAVVNDVLMASKLVEHMDTAIFLAKDLQGFRAHPQSFLQLTTHAEHEAAAEESPLSFVQDGDTSGTGQQDLIESSDSSAVANEGPLDKVTQMISGLLKNLKAEANEEVNKHQFCQDSLGKNRNDRIAKQRSVDTLASTIRWSQMAIVRLDDDTQYLDAELKRLSDMQSTEARELAEEKKRVSRELAEHKLANEVVSKAVVILTQLCDLKGSALLLARSSDLRHVGASLIQHKGAKQGSRFAQCKEAVGLLKSAVGGLKSLDAITKGYIAKYTDLSDSIIDDARAATRARGSELKATRATRAQRGSELATAVKDKKEAEQELKLIDTTKKELEHQCTHVETREEKIAKRKDQIDSLKEALNVLEGDALP